MQLKYNPIISSFPNHRKNYDPICACATYYTGINYYGTYIYGTIL